MDVLLAVYLDQFCCQEKTFDLKAQKIKGRKGLVPVSQRAGQVVDLASPGSTEGRGDQAWGLVPAFGWDVSWGSPVGWSFSQALQGRLVLRSGQRPTDADVNASLRGCWQPSCMFECAFS